MALAGVQWEIKFMIRSAFISSSVDGWNLEGVSSAYPQHP